MNMLEIGVNMVNHGHKTILEGLLVHKFIIHDRKAYFVTATSEKEIQLSLFMEENNITYVEDLPVVLRKYGYEGGDVGDFVTKTFKYPYKYVNFEKRLQKVDEFASGLNMGEGLPIRLENLAAMVSGFVKEPQGIYFIGHVSKES